MLSYGGIVFRDCLKSHININYWGGFIVLDLTFIGSKGRKTITEASVKFTIKFYLNFTWTGVWKVNLIKTQGKMYWIYCPDSAIFHQGF